MSKSISRSMSLRNRFRVFKRDKFKCKYCGRGVPDVVLEVDHITPVSKGGSNAMSNLITSCFDCNRGKSNEELSDIPESIESTLEEEIKLKKERQKQIDHYDKELRKIREKENEKYDDLGVYWWDNFVKEEKRGITVFANKSLTTIKTFSKHLTPMQIKECMDTALDRNLNSERIYFKYFCGVCWNIIKQKGFYNG